MSSYQQKLFWLLYMGAGHVEMCQERGYNMGSSTCLRKADDLVGKKRGQTYVKDFYQKEGQMSDPSKW